MTEADQAATLIAGARERWRAGAVEAAAEICRQILKRSPGDVAALHLLGVILAGMGLGDDAAPFLERALAGNPGLKDAWFHLGNVERQRDDMDAAVAAYASALELDPGSVEIRNNLALSLADLGHYEAARGHFETILESQPDDIGVLGNLGNVLRDLGRRDAALACFDTALGLAPGDPRSLGNKALAVLKSGDPASAAALFRDALAADPESEPLHSNLAQALLQGGDFETGWREFEWRLEDPEIAARFAILSLPRWDGGDADGKTIVVCCEQGLGDALQFVRFIPRLAARGARVLLRCPTRMTKILGTIGGLAGVIGDEDAAPPGADAWVPLLSLPHCLGLGAAVSAATPYLAAAPDLVEKWRHRLAGGGLKIGLAWQGNRAYRWDRQRSIPLDRLLPLTETGGARFFVLQKGWSKEQLDDCGGAGLEDLGPGLDEGGAFADTAAVIANLDLIITSDTAIPHLAGALGRPVWMVLPFAPDWRWPLGPATSPWYPSLRMARQTEPGDWSGPVDRLRRALTTWLAAGGEPNAAFDGG